MIETRRVCVLPMAHLTTATVADIRAGAAHYFAAAISEDMLIAWAPDERGSQPDDLWDALAWASAQDPRPTHPLDRGGFDYVMFDRDCDSAAPDLPLYAE